MTNYKKLTITVASDQYDDLVRLGEERGISLSELFRQAIALDKFVWEHRSSEPVDDDGGRTSALAAAPVANAGV